VSHLELRGRAGAESDVERKRSGQWSDGILPDLSPSSLVEAIEGNMCAFRTLLGRLPGAALHDEPDLLWFANRIPDLALNAVLRARFPSHEVDARIDQVLSAFRSRGAPVIWWTSPLSQPADLGERLVSHGLVHHGDVTGMAMDLSRAVLPENPPGLEVKPICDAETRHAYDAVLEMDGLPAPVRQAVDGLYVEQVLEERSSWLRYVGLLADEPVAVSDLYLGAGVAGIYDVTTIEGARRQGIGAAMTAAPLREARRRGYRVAILHATDMALGLYRRLGFEAQCRLSQYVVFWSFPW